MRQLSYLFILFLISCQTNKEQSEFVLDNNMVDPFFRDERLTPTNSELQFYTVNEFNHDLDNNGENDQIILKKIKGWENDPGDFQQIVIKMSDGSTWSETNFYGWVKFDQNYQVPENIKQQNTSSTDLFLITDFGGTKLLGLFGWAYASEPGILTLIEFSSGQPRILLNKNLDIIEIGQNKITARDEFQTCTIELVNREIKGLCK